MHKGIKYKRTGENKYKRQNEINWYVFILAFFVLLIILMEKL